MRRAAAPRRPELVGIVQALEGSPRTGGAPTYTVEAS
jgi:hypothetical protein